MSSDMPTYAELQAEIAKLRSEMLRYLPVINKAEQYRHTWDFLTEGTGIATANGYRAALGQEKRQ
ncbi:hypothetical protein [Delftia tsuruhatensis]|uniref:hypothetical protein n=1 Tax=Delftia tsuruhatensis TaxID=180282 RepID=UPI002260907C|nr:hypothetical protein [Delftia tsuruhatensis]MCX7509578.1 hypothetical protein [Delftia tsuruhatensis]